ncbi:MAG: hypothetical protein M1826_000604 [Phylliscum demangeonii]|nr:MAG: hypothetical protein M1826_000604 [Phylliscum demangeonii]
MSSPRLLTFFASCLHEDLRDGLEGSRGLLLRPYVIDHVRKHHPTLVQRLEAEAQQQATVVQLANVLEEANKPTDDTFDKETTTDEELDACILEMSRALIRETSAASRFRSRLLSYAVAAGDHAVIDGRGWNPPLHRAVGGKPLA